MPEATLRRVAPVPHNRLTHGRREEAAVAAVVASGHWAGGGRVEELERRLAERAGVPFAVCVGSGLAALRLSLRALGIGKGSRVVVPAYSCVALANAALSLGARPVAVDVEPGTWNLDAAATARQQADAAVVVHTFGCRADVAGYRDGAGATIEDCAHAFGLPGLGAGGDVAILSFYATKLVGAGEGGAVLTRSEEIAASVRAHRDYTDLAPDGSRLNDKLTDLEAALALCQLDRLDDMLAARARLAQRYGTLLADATHALRLPVETSDRVWYRYAVELTGLSAAVAAARLEGVGVLAAEPVADWRPPGGQAAPVADAAYRSLLSLPLFPTLTDDEQHRVVDAVLELCG
jgi:perosamine synthetase